MIQIAILWTAIIGGVDAKVETLGGEAVTGQVTAISGEGVEVTVDGGTKSYPVAELLRLTPTSTGTSLRPSLWITLTDGTTLEASTFVVSEGIARVELVSGAKVSVNTRSLKTVRFKELQPEKLKEQWEDILGDKDVAGDVIVIRKETTRTVGDAVEPVVSLDYLDGIFSDVNEDVVTFIYDDKPVEVKRAKIQGMIYYHPTAAEYPSPVAFVVTSGGSRIAAKSVTLQDDMLAITSLAGATIDLPVGQVRDIDFSAGKITFLADLGPHVSDWIPFLDGGPLASKLEAMFAPRMNESFAGGPLRVDGKSYDRGIAVHSRTTLEFRLPGNYRKLRGIAGIDDAVAGGNVKLVINADGREVFSGTVASGQPAEELDLDIDGAKRLVILVDYGEDLDIGDHLNLCNLRVTK